MSLTLTRKRPDGTVEEMDAEKLWAERDAAEQDAARLAEALLRCARVESVKELLALGPEVDAALAAHEARVKGGAP